MVFLSCQRRMTELFHRAKKQNLHYCIEGERDTKAPIAASQLILLCSVVKVANQDSRDIVVVIEGLSKLEAVDLG